MNLGILVWRNLVRRPGRFAFTLAGVAVGIAAFVALLTLGQGLSREIRRQAQGLGANLVVTPKGWCAYEQISVLTGEQLPEAIAMTEFAKVAAVPGVRTAVPYLNQRTAFRNRPVPLIGIQPKEMQALQGWRIGAGRYFQGPDEEGVVIGAAIAQQFELKPGENFTVRGRPLPVLGVLDTTGTKDDVAAFAPLPVVQRIYETEGKISFIAVQVDDLEKTDEISLRIQEAANVAVVSDKQLVNSVLSIVGTVGAAMQAVAIVGVVAAAFGIANTLMTAVYERRREIGILQAIGGTRRTLFLGFLLESGLYGALGGLIGVGLGVLAAYWIGPSIADNPFTAALRQSPTPALDPSTIAGVLVFSIALALLAGFYPAWRAARLTPMDAIRHV
ncbi:ABC transporter permease [Methylobacterium nonmethylotrophicum]|uniref:ABC transporter permease n=1 Tax=Methylobacterium nonmethylotrophicum TaxID=1141884 RepID=A0A4Z0NDC3_9HYPH|nr:ABC transporter permease [Methylobacterium nonmethylotrophicum]TGD92267.1 ABC transporter permease [Methylobacterium nonmethylotrophicum]